MLGRWWFWFFGLCLSAEKSPDLISSSQIYELQVFFRLSALFRCSLHLPLINEAGKKIQFSFEPFFQSDGSDLIREAVLRDLGIAFLPTWMMIDHEALAIKALDRFVSTPSPIYIVSTGSQDLTAKQRAFADFIRLKFEEIGALSLRGK